MSTFREFDRASWAALADATPLPFTDADLAHLTSIGDRIDLAEAGAIYHPLSALLQLHALAKRRLGVSRQAFLRSNPVPTSPFIIGVAGSVAVGKSTTARLLQELMRRWPATPRVELVATDGFLLPNRILEERGIMDRKGFPESYDRRALLRFLTAVKSGTPQVQVPEYSHILYDIVPGKFTTVRQPDILIVEGLNVLQPARTTPGSTTSALAVSDFFDFSIYVDARESDIERWYVDRFFDLRQTVFTREDSYFRNYADLSEDEALQQAKRVWRDVNLANLVENILPTRSRADLIITKAADHRVHRILLRKL